MGVVCRDSIVTGAVSGLPTWGTYQKQRHTARRTTNDCRDGATRTNHDRPAELQGLWALRRRSREKEREGNKNEGGTREGGKGQG